MLKAFNIFFAAIMVAGIVITIYWMTTPSEPKITNPVTIKKLTNLVNKCKLIKYDDYENEASFLCKGLIVFKIRATWEEMNEAANA